MTVLALRCCFAEINVAMAPSLWTGMQNNLGQIKPVVFAVIRRPAQQFWRLRKKVKESGINACSLSDVLVTAAAVTNQGERWKKKISAALEIKNCTRLWCYTVVYTVGALIVFPCWP